MDLREAFSANYVLTLDPEQPGSGDFSRLFEPDPGGGRPRVLRISYKAEPTWHARLHDGLLARPGLTLMSSTPSPELALVVLAGRGYLIDTSQPGAVRLVPIEPITSVVPVKTHSLILAITPWQIAAVGQNGPIWVTSRVAVDGLRFVAATNDTLHFEADRGDEWVPIRIDVKRGRAIADP